MGEYLTDEEREMQSLLTDMVTAPDDDTAYLGYQDSAIWKFAALLVKQEQRIAALEAKVAAPQTFPIATHAYDGEGFAAPCRAVGYGTACGEAEYDHDGASQQSSDA